MTRILLLALLLSGCSTVGNVQPPKEVTVVVEKRVALDPWVTEPLPRPAPADDTIRALIDSHDARGRVIDEANCRALLIRRIESGEKVKPSDCGR